MNENMWNPGFRKKFTFEQREHIRKLWERGWSVGEIAAEMGKPANTIYACLKKGFVKDELLPNGRYKYDPRIVRKTTFGKPPKDKKDKE